MRRSDKLYHLHVPIVLKSGTLNLLETSGTAQACNGIALPFIFIAVRSFNNLFFVKASDLSNTLREYRVVRLKVNASLPNGRDTHCNSDTVNSLADKCILNSSLIPYCALAETRIEEGPDRTTHGGEIPPTLTVVYFTRHCIAERLVAW